MQNDLAALKEKLSQAKEIAIFLADSPTLDVVAAGLSLYLSLKDQGKSVSILCAAEATVRDSRLVGVNELKNELSGGNLVLTVNVEGDVVDKVTSSTDGGKLSLTIIPKPGTQAITPSDIVFGSSGGNCELALILGAGSLEDLGGLYTKFSDLLGRTPLANLSNKPGNFGAINLVDTNSSLSELTTALLQELNLRLNEDIAGNLMQGIEEATNNFQSEGMTADTFEALAILYRAGARHHQANTPVHASIVNDVPIINEREEEDKKDIQALENELRTDWLKPKIFTSASDK